jgi:hypothetical protein
MAFVQYSNIAKVSLPTGRQAQEADRIRLLAMAERIYRALPADADLRYGIIDELKRIAMRELDEQRAAWDAERRR